jgi:hypothetical protein
MSSRFLVFVTGLVAALVVAQPGVSVAQAAGQDSVAGFATPEFTGSIHQEYAFDVHAGPSGQAPTGNVFALVKSTDDVSRLIRNEPVCLTVNGNRATIGVKVIDPPTSVVGVLFFVEDNGGTGADRFGAVGLETVPTACPLEPTVALTPLVQGNLSVVDAARPQIASVVPAANATEVLPNVTVVVGFDSPMDKPSAEAAFSLKRTSGGTPVTGSFGWYGNALLFKPNGDLAGGTQYTASVSTAAKNLGGHPLGAAKTWRFTTTNRPIIDTVYPVDGATGPPGHP